VRGSNIIRRFEMDSELIEKEFDRSLIKSRKGRAGNTLSYVETSEYIKRLNSVFDYNWSFEIVDEKMENGFVVVKGKLTAEGITKSQYGTSHITVGKDSGEVLAIGDDMKSAGSDALKKCCSLFGIGLHLYNGADDGNGNNGNGGGNNGMNRPTGNKGNDMATKAQLGKIKAVRSKLGMTSDEVLDLIERMYNTRDVNALNKEMASALISVLEKREKGNNEEEAI
jgi:hypothetical protein